MYILHNPNVQYSSSGFSKYHPTPTPSPPPPHPHPPDTPGAGGVDFLAHHGSSQYPTPITPATDFSPAAFPPGSLRKTTHLPVELRGGQKFILAS